MQGNFAKKLQQTTVIDVPILRRTIHQITASEYETKNNIFGKENDVIGRRNQVN